MNASGMIVPNESANNSSISEVDNTSFNTTTSSIGSTSWAPNRLLRGLLSFSRPLSPIASSPRSTPPLTPEASPRYSVPPARHTPPSVSITLNPISHSNNLESVQESPGSIHPSANSSPTRPSLLNIQAAQMYNSSIMRETRSLTPSPMDIKPIYEAESPDELALVDAAYKYGCRLLRRSLHNILVSLPGKQTSQMSVFVRYFFVSLRMVSYMEKKAYSYYGKFLHDDHLNLQDMGFVNMKSCTYFHLILIARECPSLSEILRLRKKFSIVKVRRMYL